MYLYRSWINWEKKPTKKTPTDLLKKYCPALFLPLFLRLSSLIGFGTVFVTVFVLGFIHPLSWLCHSFLLIATFNHLPLPSYYRSVFRIQSNILDRVFCVIVNGLYIQRNINLVLVATLNIISIKKPMDYVSLLEYSIIVWIHFFLNNGHLRPKYLLFQCFPRHDHWQRHIVQETQLAKRCFCNFMLQI